MKLALSPKHYAIALFIFLFLTMRSTGLHVSSLQKVALSPLTGKASVVVEVATPPLVNRARDAGASAQRFLPAAWRGRLDQIEPSRDDPDHLDQHLVSGYQKDTGYSFDSVQFKRFVQQVSNGQKDVVRGLYVEELLALPVVQQPEGNPGFVSNKAGTLTEFQNASAGKVTGLLAHNYLAGSQFYDLQAGQDIRIVYGDGYHRHYRISGSYGYQKLTPNDPFSELIELSSSQRVTSTEVFNRYYRGEHHLTLQTCLKNGKQLNWGLTFWVALPVEE